MRPGRNIIPVLHGDESDLEEAWKMYCWMEATDWHFLPDELQRQDELLMENIFQIAYAVNRLKPKPRY